jgi:hypothetical protein
LLPSGGCALLGCEKAVGELNLSKKIIFCYPSNLPVITETSSAYDHRLPE